MGQVILIQDGHPSKIDISSLFYQSSLFATTSRNKKQSSLATINDRLCRPKSFKLQSSSSNSKAQDPQDCSQSASRIIKIFFVARSMSRSQQPYLS
jgi:hypothetical protein